MSVTGGIMAGIGAAGSLGGAALSANAAGNAASDQSQAAEQAAQLQYQASQNALGFQEQQWNTEQGELAPYLQSGTGALSNLDYLMGVTPQGAAPNTAVPSGLTLPGGGSTGLPGPAMGGQTQPLVGTQSPGMQLPGAQSQPMASGAPLQGPAHGGPAQALSGIQSTPASFAQSTPVSGLSRPTASTPTTATPILTSAPSSAASAPSQAGSPAGGFGSLMTPYSGTFTAPTAQQALNSPGEQAQLQLGEQALQQSAAAQGNLLTGGTAEALNGYAQNLASTNYQNTYNNAYNTYATGYNQYEQNQANQFNRLSALAGGGQTAAGQLGTLGQGAANAVSSNLLGTASAIGQDTQNAGAANASGVVGAANAYGGALSGGANNISQMLMLQQLLGSGGGAAVSNQNELTGAGF